MAERVFNFSAGPAIMPEAVLEEAQAEVLDWHGSGMSVAEMSHRGDEFLGIAHQAESDIRELLAIPSNYKVLFLQGGATGQFAAIPMNLAQETDVADYVITGTWGKKAAAEAGKYLEHVHIVSETRPHTHVPDQLEWQHTYRPAYVHITPNETIEGVAFASIPSLEEDIPLVSDESSRILSAPLVINSFAVIYAGAQKNIGPAGLTLVIVREDILDRGRSITPSILDWKLQVTNESMVNTPPTTAIYMAGLVFKWLKQQGGLEAMAELNARKASKLYRAIDESELYVNPVRAANRSIMNVPFLLRAANLKKLFLEEASRRKLHNLEGHRSVGGMRASIYNAMPQAGVEALVHFMHEFEQSHF